MRPSDFSSSLRLATLLAVLAVPALGASADERAQHALTLDEALSRADSRNCAVAIERESWLLEERYVVVAECAPVPGASGGPKW